MAVEFHLLTSICVRCLEKQKLPKTPTEVKVGMIWPQMTAILHKTSSPFPISNILQWSGKPGKKNLSSLFACAILRPLTKLCQVDKHHLPHCVCGGFERGVCFFLLMFESTKTGAEPKVSRNLYAVWPINCKFFQSYLGVSNKNGTPQIIH